VATCARLLNGSDVKVAAVVSFPFGADTRSTKTYAIKNAVANGAREIDVVMNLSRFKSGDYDGTARDMSDMVDAVRGAGGARAPGDGHRVLLKIIIETCYLTDPEKTIAARLVRDAGADFVKTSTGTGPAGATAEDIRLIRRSVGPGVLGIKAAGGIRTMEHALLLLDAGANRIGTSNGVSLYESYCPEDVEP
jgi:deoxyribose-phosphate aldolase